MWSKGTKTSAISILLVLLVGGIGVHFALNPPGSRATDATEIGSPTDTGREGRGQDLSQPDPGDDRAEGNPSRQSGSVVPQEPWFQTGWLVDATWRTPVAGTIQCKTCDISTQSMLGDGVFRLGHVEGDEVHTVTASAVGYLEMSSEVEADRPGGSGRWLLSGVYASTVTVVTDLGTVVEGAELTGCIRSAPDPLGCRKGEAYGASIPLGTTDADGRATIRSPVSFSISATEGELRARPIVLRPAESGTLTLTNMMYPTKVRIVDAESGEGVSSGRVRVGASSAGRYGMRFVTSDESGVVLVPPDMLASPSLRVEIPYGAPFVFAEAQGPSVHILRSEPSIARINFSEQAGELSLLVHVSGFVYRLLDSESREPVAGRATVSIEFRLDSGEWDSATRLTAHAGSDGIMRLPSVIDSKHAETMRLQVSVNGYRPQRVVVSALQFSGHAGQSPEELTLTKGSRQAVILISGGGVPQPTERVTISDGGDVKVLFSGSPNPDGNYGPFSIDTTTSLVVHTAYGSLLGRVSIPAETQDDPIVLRLRLEQDSLGSIEVMLSAELSTPIFAVNEVGRTFQFLKREGRDVAVLHDLVPGDYVVGPLAWCEASWHRLGDRKFVGRVRVESGETDSIDWDPRWAATRPVTGQINIEGLDEHTKVELVPVYSSRSGSINLNLVAERLTLSEQGRYEISVGDALPEAVVVVTRNDRMEQHVVPCAVVSTGSVASVTLSTLALSVIEGGPSGSNEFVVSTTADAEAEGLEFSSGSITLAIPNGDPLVLPAVRSEWLDVYWNGPGNREKILSRGTLTSTKFEAVEVP